MLKFKLQSGFSLIELSVVLAIIALVASLATVNFSTIRVRQESARIVANLRRAQSLAISGSGIQDSAVCGYGMHFIRESEYVLFEGRSSGGLPCQLTQRKYKAGVDRIIESFDVSGRGVAIAYFKDIFFEPPNPKIYFDDVYNFGDEEKIYVRKQQDQPCSQSVLCSGVAISSSGRIELLDLNSQR